MSASAVKGEHAPMPVIVGAPRSGTTLLRLMLDSHSQLAIPPETGFIPGSGALVGEDDDLRAKLLDWITTFPEDAPSWIDFGISVERLQWEFARLEPFTVADGVRAFYRVYAERFDKGRWGDKTPGYALQIREVEQVLPEARFIHLIRDGRDVALSWRETFFAPGRSIDILARSWRDWVSTARKESLLAHHYLEVRFEELITDPETALREVCEFVGLRFEPEMLNFYERSPARLIEHRERVRTDGQVVVSHETRLHQQVRTTTPIDPRRIGAWREVMTPDEHAAFISQAGDLLVELGYA